MTTRRRRGIAIVMAMLISTLLVVLMGAFFQINRDNLQGYTVNFRQKQAFLTAVAGLNHARILIEHNQNWGKAGITTPTRTLAGAIRVDEIDGAPPMLRGTMLGAQDGKTFEVLVYNNLGIGTTIRTIGGVEVPPDACKLRVVGLARGFRSELSVTLTGEPLYDSSAISQRELDMSRADKWILRSKDPRRNWVRSNTGIITPDILSPAGVATSPMIFDNSDTGSTIRGVAWTRGDIMVAQPPGPNVDVTTNLSAAVRNTQGQFAPKSTLRNDIYNLSKNDLKFPTAEVDVRPGQYVISDVEIDFNTTVDFVSTDDDDDGGGGDDDDDTPGVGVPARRTLKTLTYIPPGGGTPEVWYRNSDLASLVSSVRAEAQAAASPLAGEDQRAQARTPSFSRPAGADAPDGVVELNGSGGGFKFTFDNNTFTLDGDKKYNVNGDFEVGYNDAGGSSEVVYRPQVNFLGGGLGSTALDVQGKVEISGTVNGKAAIAAGGDITFTSGADATATTAQPLVVYSGGTINIVAASSAENFLLKGLIYADNNFNLVQAGGSTALRNVEFQGAIIAQSGAINMGDADKVSFVYDPAYIEAFTTGLPGNRRRLKQAAFILH